MICCLVLDSYRSGHDLDHLRGLLHLDLDSLQRHLVGGMSVRGVSASKPQVSSPADQVHGPDFRSVGRRCTALECQAVELSYLGGMRKHMATCAEPRR